MGERNKNYNVAHEREYHGNFQKGHTADGWKKNKLSNRQTGYRYFNNVEYGTNRGGYVQSNNEQYRPPWYVNKKTKKWKKPSRPNSPDEGSEEYMINKVQKTSAIIMRQLLSPEESIIPLKTADNKLITVNSQLDVTPKAKNKRKRKGNNDKPECSYGSNKHKKNSKNSSYNVEKIHDKIMSHLSNLNEGRKKNLISNPTSVFDDAINDIMKQRRLEISRALRSVYLKSSDVNESSDLINSIIPDMGIKIEELPEEVLEELQNSLNNLENFEDSYLNYSNVTEENTSTEEVIEDNDNVIPAITEEIVEILRSDVLIGTPSVCSTPAYLDLNDTDITPDLSTNVDVDTQNLEYLNKETSKFDTNETRECSGNPAEIHVIEEDQEVEQTDSHHNDLEPCSYQFEAGTSSNQVDGETSSTRLDAAGTCSIQVEAGTSSTGLDAGILSTQFDSRFGRKNQSSIIISDDDDDLADGILNIFKMRYIRNPRSYAQAVERMFVVDKCIAQLTAYRQNLFVTCVKKRLQVKSNYGITKNQPRAKKKPKLKKIAQPTEIAEPTEIAQPTNSERPAKKAKKVKNAEPTTSTNIENKAQATETEKKKLKKKKKKKKNTVQTDTDVPLTSLAAQAASASAQTKEVQIPLDTDAQAASASAQTKEVQIPLDTDGVRVKEEPEAVGFEMIDAVPKESTVKDGVFDFNDINEKVLVLKVCKDKLLAATESGKIYVYNLPTGVREEIMQVATLPITSLIYKEIEDSKPYLFVGSCESSLKVYNLYSTRLLHSFFLDDSVQCMDEQWGYLFLGCLKGSIIRYSIKKENLECEEKFNSDPVLVLKATVEGARKVLLIGSRDSPVIVRDAMSGLLLRKLNIMYPTVFSMIMHKHYVICGTKTFDILVFNFHDGNLEHTFKATTAKGVACMKVVGKCLFASCYNGKIYVFNLETKTLVDTMCGPGGVIISMEVLTNQVIVGTLSFKNGSIPITHSVLSQMG